MNSYRQRQVGRLDCHITANFGILIIGGINELKSSFAFYYLTVLVCTEITIDHSVGDYPGFCLCVIQVPT